MSPVAARDVPCAIVHAETSATSAITLIILVNCIRLFLYNRASALDMSATLTEHAVKGNAFREPLEAIFGKLHRPGRRFYRASWQKSGVSTWRFGDLTDLRPGNPATLHFVLLHS